MQAFTKACRLGMAITAWSESIELHWPNGHLAQRNTKYWDRGNLKTHTSLQRAFNDAFLNPRKYSIGCYTATKLVVIKGDLDCYRQKLQEVYRWRHNVYRRERDVANIHPLNAADIELLGRSPDHGGLQLEFRMSPYFFFRRSARRSTSNAHTMTESVKFRWTLVASDAGHLFATAQGAAQWGFHCLPLLLLLIPLLRIEPEQMVRIGAFTAFGHGELISNKFGEGWPYIALGHRFGRQIWFGSTLLSRLSTLSCCRWLLHLDLHWLQSVPPDTDASVPVCRR